MVWKALSGVFVAAALTVLAGCGGTTRMSVPISGPRLGKAYATAVTVENWKGSVRVVADPQASEPTVSAKVARTNKQGPKGKELQQSVSISAATAFEEGKPTLRVVSRPALGDPPVTAELTITVPRVQGTTVRNSGGGVELVGVTGAVSIENGTSVENGGMVVVRTGAAMTEPVMVNTTAGRVIYQVGPGSRGRFDVTTDRGRAEFTSTVGSVSQLRPESTRCRAVLNDGVNLVSLHSGAGNVSARVLENAATYGPEVWDGEIDWPEWLREQNGRSNNP